jgi:ribokinase
VSGLVVVGSANVDHVVVVDRLPAQGETVPATSYLSAAGGKGLNQAVAAARQGRGGRAPVTLVACLGDDDVGDGLARLLAAEGIDTRHVRRQAGTSTGVALVTVAEGGANTVVVAPLANAGLGPADVDGAAAAIGRASVVLAQLEVPLATVERALRRARDAGALTILNPAPATGVLPPHLLGLVDILVPNQTEASVLTGLPAVEAGPALLAMGCGAVVTTLGGRGALVATQAGVMAIAPFEVEAVDTTAAGDAFCGALAAGLCAGLGRPEALRRAAAAGALATTRTGAVPSLPGAGAVDALIARGEGVRTPAR